MRSRITLRSIRICSVHLKKMDVEINDGPNSHPTMFITSKKHTMFATYTIYEESSICLFHMKANSYNEVLKGKLVSIESDDSHAVGLVSRSRDKTYESNTSL